MEGDAVSAGMTNVEYIVRRHMEAMHDELAAWMEGQTRVANLEVADGEGFADRVEVAVAAGVMSHDEYIDWFNEMVLGK